MLPKMACCLNRHNVGPFPPVCFEIKFLLKAIETVSLCVSKKQDEGENDKQRKFNFCFSLKFGKKGGQEKTLLFYRFSTHHRIGMDTSNVLFQLNILKRAQPTLWNNLPQMLKTQAAWTTFFPTKQNLMKLGKIPSQENWKSCQENTDPLSWNRRHYSFVKSLNTSFLP